MLVFILLYNGVRKLTHAHANVEHFKTQPFEIKNKTNLFSEKTLSLLSKLYSWSYRS